MDNEEKKYKSYCKKCRCKTIHSIIKENIRKGVVLCCSECGKIKSNYINHQLLVEWDVQAELNNAQAELDKENAKKEKEKEVKLNGK